MRRKFGVGALTAALCGLALANACLARPFDDPRAAQIPALDLDDAVNKLPRDPACHALALSSTGGAMPKDASRSEEHTSELQSH